jgi:gag-polypeptide of LTR copia-type
MTTVAGSDAQPATGYRSATVPGTRDEKPLALSGSGIERVKPSDYDGIIKLDESLRLNDTNWVFWRVDIIEIFRHCGVEGYVKGTLLRPDPNVDPDGAENWSYNDAYTRFIISLNVTQSQKVNTLMCNSAYEVWAKLEDANRFQAFKTIFGYRLKLFHTTAGERDNIIEHLDNLKKYRQQVNYAALYDEGLKISDLYFNQIISQSLPPSWDVFLSHLVRTQTFIKENSGMMISSQRFIEIIEREYRRREQWDREFLARRPTTYVGQLAQLLLISWHWQTWSGCHAVPSRVQKKTRIHQACIARFARDKITIPNVVVSSDNLAAVRVRDLDMTLMTVGIAKLKRENATVIEADKNAKTASVLLVKTPSLPVTFDVRWSFFFKNHIIN